MIDTQMLLIESLPDMAVILFDRQYRYIICRGPLHSRLGYRPQDLEGRTLFEVFKNQKTRALLEPMYTRCLCGESFIEEFEGSETEGYFWANFTPVYQEGKVTHGLIVAKDITQEKAQIQNAVNKGIQIFKRQAVSILSVEVLKLINAINEDTPQRAILKANQIMETLSSPLEEDLCRVA